MATQTWTYTEPSKSQVSDVSYTYTNSNFTTQLNAIPPNAIINSVKITAKFKVNLYTNWGQLTVGSQTWKTGDTNNHDWVTIVENQDITSYLTGKSGASNAGELPNITVYASKRSGFVRTFQTQVTITWDYTEPHTHSEETRNAVAATCTDPGYSGDIYCKTCDEKLSSGSTIPALGHSYKSEAIAPTISSPQGYTRHTCTRSGCGHYYDTDFWIAKILSDTSLPSGILIDTSAVKEVYIDKTKVWG